MSDFCIINIGWLTSLVDSSVHLVMSLVSHGLLYNYLVHLILLLRPCVDLDGILVLCMTNCCMTPLLLDCMLHVYLGHTCIPFISKSLVSVDLYFLVMCLVGDLLLISC